MKALVLGGATVDIIVSVSDDEIERMTLHNATASYLLLEEGKKAEAETVSTHTGGGAVNAAVSMSELGLEVSCVAKLSDDVKGRMILGRLKEKSVDCKWVRSDADLPTGCAVMVSSHVRNPTVFVARGANTQLRPEEICPGMFEEQELVYVTGLSGASADCFPKIVHLAREAGCFVVANPGIRQLSSRAQPFLDALKSVDLLVMNELEAGKLVPFVSLGTGREALYRDAVHRNAVHCDETLPELLRKGIGEAGFDFGCFVRGLVGQGPKWLLVTNGREGAYLGTRETIAFCPAQQVTAMGTVGAGDACASTFSAFIAMGKGEELALKAASVNSASVVSKLDTQSGLLGYGELVRKVRKTDWPTFARYPIQLD